MKKIFIFFSLAFIQSILAQNPWSYSVTDVSHNILIPANTPNADFLIGDIIGVFYQDEDDYICVGYTEWTGENIVLTAFGASFGFDGFIPNQEMFLFHWDHQSQEINQLYPVFNTIDFSNQEILVHDGLSGISQFQVEYLPGCTNSDYIEYDEYALQDDGSCEILWRDAYFNTLETLQLTTDSLNQEEIKSDSLQLEFNNLMSQYLELEFMYNSLNSEYNEFMIQSEITIDSLSSIISYLREPLTVTLHPTWNMIGYNNKFEQDATSTLSGIVDQLFILKNNDGLIYWPIYDFNGIGNLIPGQGYQVKMKDEVEGFYFPNFYEY